MDKIGIHIFRKTFGKLWLRNGGSSYDLQKIFGHSTITMSEYYVDIIGVDRKNAFYEHNTLDNIDTFVSNEKIKLKKTCININQDHPNNKYRI